MPWCSSLVIPSEAEESACGRNASPCTAYGQVRCAAGNWCRLCLAHTCGHPRIGGHLPCAARPLGSARGDSKRHAEHSRDSSLTPAARPFPTHPVIRATEVAFPTPPDPSAALGVTARGSPNVLGISPRRLPRSDTSSSWADHRLLRRRLRRQIFCMSVSKSERPLARRCSMMIFAFGSR